MAKTLLDDELWKVVEPLLPRDRPVGRKGGRPRVPNRSCLNVILFVLKSGIAWEDVPLQLGWGSGVTAWRRLRGWRRRGIWTKLHRELLNRLGANGHIDWSRVVIDGPRNLPHAQGDSSNPRPARAPSPQAPAFGRGQGIRFRAVAANPAATGDSTGIAQATHPGSAGPLPLGCRANLQLVEPVSAPANPLRTIARYALGVPSVGMRAHLLASAHPVVLKWALSLPLSK